MPGRLRDVLLSGCALLGVPGTNDVLGLAELAGDARRLVVLLVDGLGYHLLPAAAPVAPLLADVLGRRAGTLRELASPFPSTTPTSLVSLGTGADPGDHGVLGFTVVIPGSDDVLTHVAWRRKPAPTEWQPVIPLPERAVAAGVRTAIVGRREFRHSGLTIAAYGGSARYVVADSAAAIIDGVRDALDHGTQLTYAYHRDLDAAMHLHGIGSTEWLTAAAEADVLIAGIVDVLPPDAALLVTADHGGLNVPSTSRFDVADDHRLAAGVRVIAGEPRVRYLHCERGATDDVQAAWQGVLRPLADVMTRDEAIETGRFGRVAARNRARIGDVVVVCTGDAAVFATGWGEPDRVRELIGLHGSITPAETAVPLIVLAT